MNKQKGITLIALIITIIVMLILVAVTVATALNGGLFTKAKGAGSKTQKEADRELLQAELVAAYDERTGSIDITKLRNNLGSDWRISGEAEPYTITSPNGNMYKVWANGKIEDIEEESQPQQPQQPTDQKYFTYTFDEDNKTATITGVAEEYAVKGYYYGAADYYTTAIKDGDSYITDVVLPSTVTNNEKTYTVTSIGQSAFGAIYIINSASAIDTISSEKFFTSFVIPDTVTDIGYYAFCCCIELENIKLSNKINIISNGAFDGCCSLTNIILPNSVTTIEDNAFRICTSLTNITIPNSVTSIGNYAFSGCSSLTNITIPDSVTSIGRGAFHYCSSLTNITIPNSVTSIGEQAFYQCSSLTNITIPNSVTSIGSNAFHSCSSLTNITIPDSVTSIGDGAFRGCDSLTNVTIPNSVTSIGSNAFYQCSSLTNITIPDSVTSIGYDAFIGCSSDLQINCIASSKPSGWNNNWNRKNLDNEFYTPIWGYTGE